jgi:hypothetical protein
MNIRALHSSVEATFINFGTKEYSLFIFFDTEEYIITAKCSIF